MDEIVNAISDYLDKEEPDCKDIKERMDSYVNEIHFQLRTIKKLAGDIEGLNNKDASERMKDAVEDWKGYVRRKHMPLKNANAALIGFMYCIYIQAR